MAGCYAFVSHESAVEANRALTRGRVAALPDPGLTTLPVLEMCVTNQKRAKELACSVDLEGLGLRSHPIHFLVPEASARSNGRLARFHVWADAVPEGAFTRVHDRIFVSSPMFVVLQIALARRPSRLVIAHAREEAAQDVQLRAMLGLPPLELSEADLLTWERARRVAEAACVLMEFAGTYRLPAGEGGQVAYGLGAAISRDGLRAYLDAQPASKGTTRAREVIDLAFDGSASPMETALALMLTMPVEQGGYGLPRPRLNQPIAVNGNARIQLLSSKSGMRADACWERERLVLEYDSEEFHAAQGSGKLIDDAERANSLAALGYRVLSVKYGQVAQMDRLDLLARQISEILGVKLEQPSELQRIWRVRLHALLMPRVSQEG